VGDPEGPPTPKEIAALVSWTIRVTVVLAKLTGQLHRKDDLIDCAVYSLHGVLLNYKRAKGKLKTFARPRVVGEVLDEIAAGKEREAYEVALEDAPYDLSEGIEHHPEQLAEVAGVEDFVMGRAARDLHLDGEAWVLRREAHAELYRAVEALGPAYRRLFELRYRKGLGWKEIAKTLGMPERTAKDHDHKLRRRVREILLAREKV
jgi:RNA polymerase sigma factor (sigma-70 family)